MTTSDFLRALENTLELEAGSIAGDESLSDLKWWDSLAALTFMSVADRELQVRISAGQLVSCKTIRDMLALLGHKLTP